MSILVIGEHAHGKVHGATLHIVTAASAFGKAVDVLFLGPLAENAAQEAALISGVHRVLSCNAQIFEHFLAEPVGDFLVSLLSSSSYEGVLFAATAFGKNCAPRVAALLDVMPISDVTRIVSPDTFEHPVYAGNAFEVVQSRDSLKVLTIRTSAFAKASLKAEAVEVVHLPIPAELPSAGLSSFVAEHLTKMERPELTAARVVISGGRGMQSGENFVLLEKVADRLGAAIGASRAAVDAGFVPNDYQVGQTGKVVAPELYIAVGISGAIQHVAGMKDARVIVAINKDSECAMMQMADYALVGDLFAILPELDQKLEAFLSQ